MSIIFTLDYFLQKDVAGHYLLIFIYLLPCYLDSAWHMVEAP